MSVYTQWISTVVFPLQERLKGHNSVKWRQNLERSQWLSAQEITQLQLRNLKRFLVNIEETVPYYRELFKVSSFVPSKVSSVADLERLPLLTKELIRSNTEALKGEGAQDLTRFNTGGSSGQPLIFYLGRERVSHDVAAKWRATRWWGVDIGDRELVVWGSPIELNTQDRVKLLRDKVFRSQLLSAFDLTAESLERFIDQIQKVRPKILFGYPSVISMIASYAQTHCIVLSNLGIEVIFVTSECLYEHQRTAMEQQFGCPVANGYGGRDAGFIAHQCPSGSLHLSAEDIVVEIVDSSGHTVPVGQSGEIVVTHTATSQFPFVRYRTGDMGRLSANSCSCGRGLPVLEDIHGRSTDFVRAKDGTLLHGLSLIYILRDIQGIDSFKIVQHSRQLTEIMIVEGEGYQRASETNIRTMFQQRLGNDVEINFTYSHNIEAEKSGKYRYVVSHAD